MAQRQLRDHIWMPGNVETVAVVQGTGPPWTSSSQGPVTDTGDLELSVDIWGHKEGPMGTRTGYLELRECWR